MQVLSEILTIRGYEQGEHNPLFEVWKKNDKYDIFVYNEILQKVTISLFKEILGYLQKFCGHHCIIIYKADITPYVKEILKTTNVNPMIEVFSIDELIFNITQHELQPKFEIVSSKECKFDHCHMPKFRHDDPIVKFYNWPKGTIVKVIPIDSRMTQSYRVVL